MYLVVLYTIIQLDDKSLINQFILRILIVILLFFCSNLKNYQYQFLYYFILIFNRYPTTNYLD